MESGNTYNSEKRDEMPDDFSDKWESLTNNSEEAYLATNALKKQRRHERRKSAHKHKIPTTKYNKERFDPASMRLRDTKKDARDKTTLVRAIKNETDSWGSEDVDSMVELGKLYSYETKKEQEYDSDKEAQSIIKDNEALFNYLGESTEYDPDIETKFEQITDKKERLSFLLTSPLADKVRILCGQSFGNLNSDSFADQLEFQQGLVNEDRQKELQYNLEQERIAQEQRVRRRRTRWFSDIEPEKLASGINRGVLRAAMLGTPEFGAYKLAIKIAKESGKSIPWNFPAVKGEESGIFLYRFTRYKSDGSIGDWEAIIDEYQKIADRFEKEHPELSGDELEHETVKKATQIYLKAMELENAFPTAVAWAQLGKRAQERLADASVYFDIHGIGRFIGKSGFSWRQRGLELGKERIEEELSQIRNVDDAEKEEILAEKNKHDVDKLKKRYDKKIASIDRRYNREITRTRDESRRQEYERRQESEKRIATEKYNDDVDYYKNRTVSDLTIDLQNELKEIEEKLNKSKSIAEKAADLALASRDCSFITARYYSGGGITIPMAEIDWINNAPIGIVKRAHKRYSDGMSIGEVNLLAIEETIRRIDPDIPQDLLNVLIFGDADNGALNEWTLKGSMRFATALLNGRISEDKYTYFDSWWSYLEQGNIEKAKKCFMEDYLGYNDYFRTQEGERQYDRLFDDYYGHLKKNPNPNGRILYELLKENPGASCHEIATKMKKVSLIPWLVRSTFNCNPCSYPFGANDNTKAAWCAKNSVISLGPEWGTTSIGKIILARLNTGVERDLHDATEWLSHFRTPDITYDIKQLKRDLAEGINIESLDNYNVHLKDVVLENTLLTQIVTAPIELRKKMRLSNKPQKIIQLFSAPESMFIYQKLFKYIQSDYNTAEILASLGDDINESVDRYYDEYLSNNGKLGGFIGSKDDFRASVYHHLGRIEASAGREESKGHFKLPDDPNALPLRDFSLLVQRLNAYGQRRKEYADEATTWLTKYKLAPNRSLSKAWRDRAVALSLGAEDTLKSINDTMSKHNFEINAERTYAFRRSHLEMEDFKGRYSSFVDELTRDRGEYHSYSTEDIIDAITDYDKIHNSEKLLPEKEISLQHKKGKYIGTILAHDDPRGMTIGLDTGCCMTVHGASYSCIKSGYRDKNAGFFALYEDNGQIVAQSYFYTHPREPEVLVMDNIEANQGRDANTIVDLYSDFFKTYLKERFAKDPNWKIREVHIGTQYGELVKPIVTRLPEVSIVSNPDSSVYTDAEDDQRLLFRLTDKEIDEARAANTEPDDNTVKLTPTHRTTVGTTSISQSQAALIQDLEAQLYPPEMRQYDDEEFLNDELSMPSAEDYSFIMDIQTDATKENIGYCIAYEADSETEPNSPEKCVYVADFGILPGYRNGLRTAINGLDQLLSRVKAKGKTKIEMEARESTSYRLLTSSLGQRILQARGFKLVDYGPSEQFSDSERTYLIRLDVA